MNDALSNLDSVNGQLDQLNKKKLLGNNVQQYQQALSGGQDKLLQEMKDSGNEDAYNNMYMRKMQLQQQQQPTMMDRLRGMFGGQ
jgi:hypothetical protein